MNNKNIHKTKTEVNRWMVNSVNGNENILCLGYWIKTFQFETPNVYVTYETPLEKFPGLWPQEAMGSSEQVHLPPSEFFIEISDAVMFKNILTLK